MRVVETARKPVSGATLTSARALLSAARVNFLDDELESLPVAGETVSFDVGANGMNGRHPAAV